MFSSALFSSGSATSSPTAHRRPPVHPLAQYADYLFTLFCVQCVYRETRKLHTHYIQRVSTVTPTHISTRDIPFTFTPAACFCLASEECEERLSSVTEVLSYLTERGHELGEVRWGWDIA